jgi:ubiquinol-cytochrome c reductase cytochrome b subunit
MSFWAGTVITGLFFFVPDILFFLSGWFYVSNSTLLRFFICHFILPFILFGFVIIHFSYLHSVSSSSLINSITNNWISFYPIVFSKDIFTCIILDLIYCLQLFLWAYGLSHPDNNLEIHRLITPSHIRPEWYFLWLYAVLKVIPFNIVGFLLFLIAILILGWLVEVNNVWTIVRLTSYVCICDNLFITYYYVSSICLLWIGLQFPLDVFLCSGRVLYFFVNLISWCNVWCYLSSLMFILWLLVVL